MAKLETRLTRQLASQGNKNAKSMAIAILTKRGDLKDGELTAKGEFRQSMGNAGRAKDRAAKATGHKPSEYKYNPKTNLATLKK
jgi:hypothetical protein